MVDYYEILDYIQNEIMSFYPPILDCDIHILPKSLEKNIEYIFKMKNDLSENQIQTYYDAINYKIYSYYISQNLKQDYIIILSKF